MAMHVTSACFSVFSHRRVQRIRAVASEDFATLKTEEDKVKLGGSDLKVTKLGIGAWSWGDTIYWNNFDWDGKDPFFFFNKFNVSVKPFQKILETHFKMEFNF